jgi:hypothetical protein
MAAGALCHRWGTAASDDPHHALHPPHGGRGARAPPVLRSPPIDFVCD